MMSLIREEIVTTVTQAATTATTSSVAAGRTVAVRGAVTRTTVREATTLVAAPTTSSALLPGITRGAVAETNSVISTRLGNSSIAGPGVLETTLGDTRSITSELPLAVKEAMSQASQQGLEETMDQLKGAFDVDKTLQAAVGAISGPTVAP